MDDKDRVWLTKATTICREAAAGNFEHRLLSVDGSPEVRELMLALNELLDYMDAFVRESGASLTYAAEGRFFRRVVLRGMRGAFRHAASLTNSATEHMQQQDQALRESRRKQLALADEFEQTVLGVVATVASSSTELSATVESLTDTARNTSELSAQVAAVSAQTSENVQTVAAASEELSASVSEITRQMGESSRFVRSAVAEADRARLIVESLNEASRNIGNVVQLISKIASQTNLLALNAAIEAARAGDAGKGFAVVAGEVKSLAKQTGEATEEVEAQIESIQTATRDAVTAIGEIGKMVEEINQSSLVISDSLDSQLTATGEISNNIAQAARGTRDVSENICKVSESAGQTDQSAEYLMQAAADLSRQSETLTRSVGEFLHEIRTDSTRIEADQGAEPQHFPH
ncbi:MAG: hypothetical protein KDD69_08650 [Bdellovibrionales bacterium]|nr:hypothetical protein [Bdellovibrionales bacterium]